MSTEKWIMVYMIVGQKPETDGPYWTDDLDHALKVIAPWLESRGCKTYDITGCLMPEDAYYSMIPPSPDMPRSSSQVKGKD